MAEGPGKYNAVATMALEATGAAAVILLVLGGSRGQGFEVQVDPTRATLGPRDIAKLLRVMAQQIEGS